MVDSSRRRSSRRDVLTNHNRCWIWGRHVVLETLRAGRWPILELLIGDRADDVLWDEAVQLAKQHGLVAIAMDDATLTKACHSGEHQGMAARMAPFPYATVEQLLSGLPTDAMLVVLDRLQDPFNFGAIVRSASTLGLDGIVIGQKEQVDVNISALKSTGTEARLIHMDSGGKGISWEQKFDQSICHLIGRDFAQADTCTFEFVNRNVGRFL